MRAVFAVTILAAASCGFHLRRGARDFGGPGAAAAVMVAQAASPARLNSSAGPRPADRRGRLSHDTRMLADRPP